MNSKAYSNLILFRGMSDQEITACAEALKGKVKHYKKGQIILHAGTATSFMGVVMSGSVTIESNDAWGNRTVLSLIGENEFFAETYALLKDEVMLVDAVANEDSEILLLDLAAIRTGQPSDGQTSVKQILGAQTSTGQTSVKQILGAQTSTEQPSSWANKLTSNLLAISTRKNLHLSGRSFHTAPKSIRGRVLSYLNSVSLQKQQTSFDIPFDRQQLADYLNVERSALSKELGKMKKDGLIEYHKNHFVIL